MVTRTIALQTVVFARTVSTLGRKRVGRVHVVVTEKLEGVATERVVPDLVTALTAPPESCRSAPSSRSSRRGTPASRQGTAAADSGCRTGCCAWRRRGSTNPERQPAGQRIRLAAAAAAHAAAGGIQLRLRHGCGEERQEVRCVAPVEGQLEDAFVLHHLADAQRARLDRLRVGGDRDGFLDCSDLRTTGTFGLLFTCRTMPV